MKKLNEGTRMARMEPWERSLAKALNRPSVVKITGKYELVGPLKTPAQSHAHALRLTTGAGAPFMNHR